MYIAVRQQLGRDVITKLAWTTAMQYSQRRHWHRYRESYMQQHVSYSTLNRKKIY